MLKLIKLHSKNQIWEHFLKMDIDCESWIVSKSSDRDLMSQFLMQKNGFFLDIQVQWHRTFFQMIFERSYPEFQIVSREFAAVFLRRKMQALKNELSIEIVDEKSRLRSMTYYAPLLFDIDLDPGKLEEWLNESEERRLRLKPDLLLNRLFLSFFIENKIICEDWLVAQLQTSDLSQIQLPVSKLFLDLGVDYGVMESSVIQKLAKKYEITLFQIVHSFDSEYGHLIQGYERFDRLEKVSHDTLVSPPPELRKFSSAVAESRFAVGKLKEWNKNGVSWNQMAIVATNIRNYTDVLSWQLLAEGIPVNLAKKSSLLEFPDVRGLMSDLSFYKSSLEYSSVKESLVAYCTQARLGSFMKWEEKFNSPFITSEQFLDKVNSWFPEFFDRYFGLTFSQWGDLKNREVTIQEFIKGNQIIWERNGLSERKEKIINVLFDSVSPFVKFLPLEWVEQIEEIALKTQVSISMKETQGIQVANLNQVSLINLKYLFVLGMDESGFSSQFKEAIPTDDIFKLSHDLGVYLAHPDLSVQSYLLEDVLVQMTGNSVLSYPYKDIESRIQNPASQWQNRAFEQKMIEKEMDQAHITGWDQLIDNRTSGWLNHRRQQDKLEIQTWDTEALSNPIITGFSLNEISLSPSSIQTFIDCREKFFFQRVLKLKTIESESFDIHARDKGSWYHAVFEKVIAKENEFILPWINSKFSENDKALMLEQLLVHFSDIVPSGYSESTWLLLKKSYFEKVVKFVQKEVHLKNLFPELANVAVEWPWEVHYDWKSFSFEKNPSNTTVKITGVIDRILLNQKTNQLWVVDYKSSVKNYSTLNSWIEKKEFQLLLYNHVVQNFCGETWAGKVENLSYWQLPDLSQKKGFAIADERLKELDFNKKSLASWEEKAKVEGEFLGTFKDIIVQMLEGHFYPIPKDIKKCSYCEWRLGCRAPHL